MIFSGYTFIKFCLQIPCTIFIALIGKRKALIIGNICVVFSLLFLILGNSLLTLIIYYIFLAIGFVTKSIISSSLLYDFLPDIQKKTVLYAKIAGKGNSYYFLFDSITALITGLLFSINGYLPIILCFFICIFSVYLVCQFKELPKIQSKKMQFKNEFKKQIKDVHYTLKAMKESSRLSSLILFFGVITAFTIFIRTYHQNLLIDLHLPSVYFGVIFAVLKIVSAISSKHQVWFHKRFHNKTLSVLSIPYLFTYIILGFIVLAPIPTPAILFFVFLIYTIQYAVKEPLTSLTLGYLGNFTTMEVRTKIYATANMIQSLLRTFMGILGSFLLTITDTAHSTIILACIFTIAIILILDKMRHTVGLKPEEYSKKDTQFVELK